MFRDQAKPYISAGEIQGLCQRLGQEISRDYQGKDLLALCVLKGSIIFFSDLIRHITVPVKVDFVRLSSYGASTTSSGTVRIIKDISQNIEGRHLLVVEDILDTGHTLNFFCGHLRASKPASVKICTLLDKPSRRKITIKADYCGREIEDRFVVGYGLDFDEKCRNYADVLFIET